MSSQHKKRRHNLPLLNYKRFKHFSWIGLILSMLLLCSCQANPAERLIYHTYPETGDELSAFGWVGVAFEQPMSQETVEGAFLISPDVSGQILWEDNTFWFRPLLAFADLGFQHP